MSVGCGAGDLDKEILAASVEQSEAVAYVGLEPDARQCERFLEEEVAPALEPYKGRRGADASIHV